MKTAKILIARKLLKEFRWGLGIAALWTAYSTYSTWPKSPVEILTTFFTSLFFLSFFFGQFNRVDKQVGTERRLNELDEKIAGLVGQLTDAAGKLEDAATGGGTYPLIAVHISADQKTAQLRVSTAGGGYILYNLYVRIRDHDRWNRSSSTDPHGRSAETDVERDAFVEGTFSYGTGKGLTADRHDFDIRSWARNGRWLQRLAIIRVGAMYQTFSRVENLAGAVPVVLRDDVLPAGHSWTLL